MTVDILCRERLAFTFVIGDDELHGVEDGANARSGLLEVLADNVLQQSLVDHSLHLGITDTIHEIADGLRCVTAAAQTANGRHTRIVPTGYEALLHQLQHLALGHDGVGDVETVELALLRAIIRTVGR